jgi:electron transport complex protein RnfG
MTKALDIVKPGVVLLLVAAIVALILGGISLGTSDRIADIAAETMTAAMQAVLPAVSYTDEAVVDNGEVNAVYEADNGGWVVQVTETGSQGTITMMVGVSADYTCTGISITDSSETAGLGAVASQASDKGEAFRAQFVGQSGTVAVTKEGGSVDAISGATITSKAVCQGVTAALAYCANLG